MDLNQLIKESRQVAVQAHGSQTYDIFPYVKHLDDVVQILEYHSYSGYYKIAGYLHDALEDTDLSYSKIKNAFGEQVAEIVYCVTDELGRNRKERKAKTFSKIQSNPDAIVIKLADRIANVLHSQRVGNKSMVKMYKDEYLEFRTKLYREGHSEDLWATLDGLMGYNPALAN